MAIVILYPTAHVIYELAVSAHPAVTHNAKWSRVNESEALKFEDELSARVYLAQHMPDLDAARVVFHAVDWEAV
jgi:hypothetical protein